MLGSGFFMPRACRVDMAYVQAAPCFGLTYHASRGVTWKHFNTRSNVPRGCSGTLRADPPPVALTQLLESPEHAARF